MEEEEEEEGGLAEGRMREVKSTDGGEAAMH